MGSLVLDKINYAEAKKLQIAQELNLTGNPTWNQIKAGIDTLKNSIESMQDSDLAQRKRVANKVNIKWIYLGNVPSDYQGTSTSTNDRFCYVGNKTFFIGTSKYYEYSGGGFSQKSWNSLAPSKVGGARGVWEDNGVLYCGKTSKYNPTIDNWEAVNDITAPFNFNDAYNNEFWKDYDGVTHVDTGLGKHYKFNRSIKTWEEVTWNITIYSGSKIWTDGTTIYYSNGSNQYYLDRETNTWLEKVWDSNSALSNFDGINVFYIYDAYDNKIPYYSNSSETEICYKFNVELGYWEIIKFNTTASSGFDIEGRCAFYDNLNKITTIYNINVVDNYIRTLSITKPLYNTWENVNTALDNALDYLMNN